MSAAILTIILAILQITKFADSTQIDDYKSHPCMRDCTNSRPLVCSYDWQIEWYEVLSKACLDCPLNRTNCYQKECISANGITRSLIVVNRMLPGPAINVCLGDEIRVRLNNKLHMSEGTSIHWHGLTQRGSPFMDGVSMITQCPVIAHTYFDYRFVANNHGTHFWHAHSGLQRADGVFGPIIVREAKRSNPLANLYDYDLPEHVIMVHDWLNQTAIGKFSGHFHHEGNNKPESLLINGRGATKQFLNNDQTSFHTPRAEFLIESGKAYRFRLIHSGILYCPIEFSIDSHNLTVIASDGKYMNPREVESLIIFSGERFDFIVNATQTPKPYWIRTKGFADCSVNKAFETAILFYQNGSNLDESPLERLYYANMSRIGLQLNPWNTQIIESNRNKFIEIDEMRSIPDKEINDMLKKIKSPKTLKKFYFGMEFNKINNPEFQNERLYSLATLKEYNRTLLYTPQINNISMEMPSTPVLYNWKQIPKNKICSHLDRKTTCPNMTEYCSCIYMLEFKMGDIVEMVFFDQGFTYQSNHPIHLHGFSFALIGLGKINTSITLDQIQTLDQQGKLDRNLNNPPVKDTVTVPVGGYSIFRFVADNPGSWLLHCHLDFHSEIGMALIIKVGTDKDLPKAPKNWPTCGNFDYSYKKT